MNSKTQNHHFVTLLMWFLAATGMVSCGEKVYLGDVDCSECYQEKPVESYLTIDLTMLGNGRGVPLVIYRGDVEGGQIEHTDTAYWTPYEHWVSIDQAYSVRAEYYVENATVYVVDGTKIEVRRVPDACDVECYVVVDAVMDARLNERFP